jgi:hypothetical protein
MICIAISSITAITNHRGWLAEAVALFELYDFIEEEAEVICGILVVMCEEEREVTVECSTLRSLVWDPFCEWCGTTNSKSIVFFSAQNEIFSNVGIIHAENLFDI